MLPFLEVAHLPSSSSFYSAIIQPLGLRYLSTEDGHFPSIIYGNSSRTVPVFQIRQVVSNRDRPLRTSRIVLSAPSPAAADDAYEFALRANPDDPDAHPRYSAESYVAASGAAAHRTSTSGGGIRVFIIDFDGNMIEIVYQPPPDYPSDYGGSTIRYTKSTSNEASRILDWNYDVVCSSLPSSASPSSASGADRRTASRRSYARYREDDDQSPPGPRRSVTAGPSVYEPAVSARENSNGLSAGAVVGTLLGVASVALGGAFAYNMVKGDKSRAPRQAYDVPPLTRWSTYPEKYDAYSDRKPRYVDVERGVEKVRYQSHYPPDSDYRRPPPEYIARYSEVESPRSREVDDIYDDSRGRHPSSRSRASSTRPRSESASYREPYAGGEAERRSYMSSRSSRHPPIVQRSYTYDNPDRDSYVSARSHRSSSTVRAPPPDPYATPAHLSSHSRPGTRATTRTIEVVERPRGYMREGSYISARNVPLPDSGAPTYISARDIPLPRSRATSYISARDIPLPVSRPATYVSARHVPLPESRVGSSHAKWEEEEDDDVDSIAPSDSISCVGSRRSGRY
ncbi:hypothetical protein C8A03DRAFT_16218 [Achaetomium macrosporum]|uniref:Uncharacterized protein n=1 Tax=Achaetomium macrosporum TaxID=79813 RepID=A0AAN7C860_9PEZI|nr:hypothetical protein C8A03DRAFT_16218 [Achaetomium macrosporum]